jgi:DNA processing protein
MIRGMTELNRNSPDYPDLLRQTADAPETLFVDGDVGALSLPQLAIVGSRQATPGGCETAFQFARYLAGCGFCITSGLALGIDAAAHRGALAAKGLTIAVLAGGLDQIYPARHAQLAAQISANGALVSEWGPGVPPTRERFPQRNRIISGLSVGTLVVEAGQRSGALITARYAGEQGREVFAIPGSIHNPTARGCHRLIRSGATLVESAGDIVEQLSGILSGIAQSVEQNTTKDNETAALREDPEYASLLTVMGWDPVHIDTIVSRSGLTAEEVSSMLLILELDGCVEPLTGGKYQQREEGRPK